MLAILVIIEGISYEGVRGFDADILVPTGSIHGSKHYTETEINEMLKDIDWPSDIDSYSLIHGRLAIINYHVSRGYKPLFATTVSIAVGFLAAQTQVYMEMPEP